jgi:hypothetical protein
LPFAGRAVVSQFQLYGYDIIPYALVRFFPEQVFVFKKKFRNPGLADLSSHPAGYKVEQE